MMRSLGLGGLGLASAWAAGGLLVEPVVGGLRIISAPPQSITAAVIGGSITVTGA